jgi:hypothetical protein
LEEQKEADNKTKKLDDKNEEKTTKKDVESTVVKRKHRSGRALSTFPSPALTRRKASGDVEPGKPNTPKTPSPKNDPSSVQVLIRTKKVSNKFIPQLHKLSFLELVLCFFSVARSTNFNFA